MPVRSWPSTVFGWMLCSRFRRSYRTFFRFRQYNFPPIAERIYFVREPCFLDRIRHADRASVEFAPLSCAASRMLVSFFPFFFSLFFSLLFAGVVPSYSRFCFGVTKFEGRRTFPPARPPQGFVNRPQPERPSSGFSSRLSFLLNLVPFRGFFGRQ